MSYEEGLSSSDKKERLTTLKSLFNDPNINEKEKLNYLNKGLNDKHDLIRSKAVELLSEFKNESVFELLIKRIDQESFWGTRVLILSKLAENIDFWNTEKYSKDLMKFIYDPKPKVRIQSAILLSNKKIGAWEKISEIFYDKDPEVRKEVQILLEKSPDPEIQKKVQDHLKKVQEKEKKNKELQQMFDGI
ncbi:MAG: hypothetical protein HeimC3_12660 [Candidatus Heimdallarchaeota archaeon LC_3]|nr:MAG: hypothetical protein HeimC3_12660 [Candidatus Heimdallarchaeota archaeon LC_3]